MAEPPEAPFDLSLLNQSGWPEWWKTHPPWSQDPELNDLLRLALPKEQAEWKRGGQTFQWREEFLRMLQGRWRSLAPKPPKQSSTEEREREIQEILLSYQRGLEAMEAEDAAMEAEDAAIAKQKREWAKESERLAAQSRAAEERLDASFDKLRSSVLGGLDGAIAKTGELLRRNQQADDPTDSTKGLTEAMHSDLDQLASIHKNSQSAESVNTGKKFLNFAESPFTLLAVGAVLALIGKAGTLAIAWILFSIAFHRAHFFEPQPKARQRLFDAIASIFIGLLVISSWYAYFKPKPEIVTANIETQSKNATTPPVGIADKSAKRTVLDVKPEYLADFFKKYNDAQAQKLIESYVGKWVQLSGEVIDVSRYKSEPNATVTMRVTRGATHFGVIAEIEEERWADRALVLRRDEQITVFGRLAKITALSPDHVTFWLDKCELVEGSGL